MENHTRNLYLLGCFQDLIKVVKMTKNSDSKILKARQSCSYFLVFQNRPEVKVMNIYIRNLVAVLAENWISDENNSIQRNHDILETTILKNKNT